MNKRIVPFIATVVLSSAAEVSIAGPDGGHPAAASAGAMGGVIGPTPTTAASQASRDWTSPAHEARWTATGWTANRRLEPQAAPVALLDRNSKLAAATP